MTINDEDIELRAWSERYHGGQHTNGPDSGIIAHHKPTGLAVVSTSERSQMGNKTKAIARLRTLLEDIETLDTLLEKVTDPTTLLHERFAPARITVDDASFDRLTDAIENPREPNAALVDLFRDLPDGVTFTPALCDHCGRRVSKSAGCKDVPPTCSARRCECEARMAGECACGAWRE